MVTKQKKPVYYFQAITDQQVPLEECINHFYGKAPTVATRLESLLGNGSTMVARFLNYRDVGASSGTCCGLVYFEPGAVPLTFEKSALELPDVELAAIAKDESVETELAQSVLYFLAKGNHVVVKQSALLRVADLEEHLNGMFHKHGVLTADKRFRLVKLFTSQAQQDISKVGRIVLGANLVERVPERRLNPDSKRMKLYRVPKLKTGPKDFISKFTGTDLDSLKLDDTLESEALHVKLEISLRGGKPNHSQVMPVICNALRDVQEADLKLELPNGKVLEKDTLFLQGNLSVDHDGKQIVRTALYGAMRDWLDSLAQSGVLP